MNELLIAAILALGIARLTLIIVRDDIFKPVRNFVFMFSPPENSDMDGYYYQNYIESTQNERDRKQTIGNGIVGRRYIHVDGGPHRPAGFWGQVISCPDCSGIYIALTVLAAYATLGIAVVHVMSVFATSMVVSLIARRY